MERITNPTQEWWFHKQWIPEAISLGFIDKYTEEEDIASISMFDGFDIPYTVTKTLYKGTAKERVKTINKKKVLLKPAAYTPDGVIEWNSSAKGILFDPLDDPVGVAYFKAQLVEDTWITVLDVKAPVGANRRATDGFSLIKKFLWFSRGVYVTKVMLAPPPKKKGNLYLFSSTWTPNRYLWTDKLTKFRTIHYPVRTAKDFIEQIKEGQ